MIFTLGEGKRLLNVESSAGDAFSGEGREFVSGRVEFSNDGGITIIGVSGAKEGDCACDVGCGHGCPAESGVRGIGGVPGGVDGGARCSHVNGECAVVGVVRIEFITRGCGGDRDDIIDGVVRRVAGSEVVIGEFVAGGCDEDHAGAFGSDDGALEGRGEFWTGPACVHDFCAVEAGVIDAGDGVRGGAEAIDIEKFAGHNLDFPTNAGDAFAVVADGADDAGDVSAVAVIIGTIAGVVNGIEAVNVINDSVPIVVDAVAGNFGSVGPDVGREIFVSVTNASVDDGDDDPGGVIMSLPGNGGIDIAAGCSIKLAGVLHGPELIETRIVRNDGGVEDIIGFGEFNQAAVAIILDGLLEVFGSVGFEQLNITNLFKLFEELVGVFFAKFFELNFGA